MRSSCERKSSVKSDRDAEASSGVAQWNGWRIPSRPCASSSRNAAHIWRIASENPNSKIAPVIVGYADCEPRSTTRHSCAPPGAYCHSPERLRQLRRVGDRAFGAVDLDRPRVHLAGRDPLRLDPQRELPPAVFGLAEQHRVVPRVAGNGLPVRAGPLAEDVGENRTHVQRHPSRAERQVDRVHAEVAQRAVSAVQHSDSLPVDRLAGVEVARVEKLRAHLEHAAEAALGDPAGDRLPARIERQLGGATDE